MTDDPTPTLASPDPDAAREVVADALDRGDAATVAGRCTMTTEVSAAGEENPAVRLVLLKPDGATAVHAASGYEPVAGRSAPDERTVTVSDGSLVVRATDEDGTLALRFERLRRVSVHALADDSGGVGGDGHEALKERVLADPDVVEPGFTPLATERETAAGRVDVYGEDADGRTVVLELKRGRAGPDAVGQLERYVDALGRELHAGTTVRGILVAPSATDRARQLLAERDLTFVAVDPP